MNTPNVYPQPPSQEVTVIADAFDERVLTPHMFTEKGTRKSELDMFVHYQPWVQRSNPRWTYPGNKWPENDTPDKQLVYLVKWLLKQWHEWSMAEIRDNRIPQSEVEHKILKLNRREDSIIIPINRLHDYPFLFTKVPMPSWLCAKK